MMNLISFAFSRKIVRPMLLMAMIMSTTAMFAGCQMLPGSFSQTAKERKVIKQAKRSSFPSPGDLGLSPSDNETF